MPGETKRGPDAANDGRLREDEAMPAASEDNVLEETARLAREGRKELDADPRESKTRSE